LPEPITDAELAAMLARANAATEGPWTIHLADNTVIDPDGFAVVPGGVDGIFIANCRRDVPALIAEVRRLRAAPGAAAAGPA
jgi:hypothetical protein